MAYKRLWLVLLLILGVLVVVCCAAGLVWWQYYKTTPAYTLALLVDASQRNDDAAFDRIVDMDKVLENFVPQVVERAAPGVTPLLRTQLQSLVPGVMSSVRQVVKDEIRKQVKELAGPNSRPFFLTAIAMRFKADISETDKAAKAIIGSGDHQIELSMERQEGSHWKVVSVRDEALTTRIVDEVMKSLPGSGSQLEKDLRKQLEALPFLK